MRLAFADVGDGALPYRALTTPIMAEEVPLVDMNSG